MRAESLLRGNQVLAAKDFTIRAILPTVECAARGAGPPGLADVALKCSAASQTGKSWMTRFIRALASAWVILPTRGPGTATGTLIVLDWSGSSAHPSGTSAVPSWAISS